MDENIFKTKTDLDPSEYKNTEELDRIIKGFSSLK
jgi:hypothetical protein